MCRRARLGVRILGGCFVGGVARAEKNIERGHLTSIEMFTRIALSERYGFYFEGG